jgi:hypothetical protein
MQNSSEHPSPKEAPAKVMTARYNRPRQHEQKWRSGQEEEEQEEKYMAASPQSMASTVVMVTHAKSVVRVGSLGSTV